MDREMSSIVNTLEKNNVLKLLKSFFNKTISSDDLGIARHESYSEFVAKRNSEKFFTGLMLD